MDLKHARTFVTVAELGTVSKAAQRLHIAQPALSRQIGDFEQELGLLLFDRVGRRLVLTSAGEQLLGDCRALLDNVAALKEHAAQLQAGDQGVLQVAASPQIIEGAIAAFLPRYTQAYPKVQVKLIEAMGWADVVGLLERGDIHLGLNLVGAVGADDARFDNHRLEPIDLLAACHPSHALARSPKVEIEQLASEPLLLLDASYVFRRKFDGACRLAGVQPKVAYESRTPHTLLAMAESGHGVAIIPSGLRTDRHQLRIAALTYRGKPLREHLTMYWDRRRTLPRHGTAFCDMLAAYMREVFPISRPSATGASKRR
jgi:DNA-binding transcriptional LysR family regulator